MTKIEIDEKDFEEKMHKALQGIAWDLQEALKAQLGLPTDPTNMAPYGNRGKFTGRAQSLITGKVEGDNVVIEMPRYMKFLEFGAPHTVDDVDALKEWVRLKLLEGKAKPGQSKRSHERQVEKMTQRILEKIERQGPVPFPFIRHTFNTQINAIVSENLVRAFG